MNFAEVRIHAGFAECKCKTLAIAKSAAIKPGSRIFGRGSAGDGMWAASFMPPCYNPACSYRKYRGIKRIVADLD